MAFIELQYIYGTSTPIPYQAGELLQLQTVQSGNQLYVVHPNHQPAVITRVSASDWRYERMAIRNGPYMDQTVAEESTTLSLSSVTDRVYLTTTDSANFSGLAIDSWIEYPLGDRWVIGQVKHIASSKEIHVDCVEERCFVASTEVYCRGNNAATPATFNPTAPASLSGTSSPVFTHSFVITRSVVGNYFRFSRSDGVVYWMQVTNSKAPTSNTASYGASCDGNLLAYRAPSGAVIRSRRVINAWLSSDQAGFFDLGRDIGRWYQLTFEGKILNAQVLPDGANSTTSVLVQMSDPVPVSKDNPERIGTRRGTSKWKKGAFYTGNYPATVTLHEQRCTFGGTYQEPNTLWMSRSGDYTDFAPVEYDGAVLDDSAITTTISSSTLNEIFWMTSRGSLLVGTAGAEWSITSSSTREALTPTNIKAEQQSSFGSIYSQASVAARSTMFLQGGGKKLRELMFDASADGHVAADATIFSEHILRDHGDGVMVAYQQLPDSRVYVVCGDGQLAVLTYEPDQKVYAWSRYILGGQNAVINSIAVDQSGTENIIYLNVTRSVNGVPMTTLETLRSEFRPVNSSDKSDMYFMDNYVVFPLGELVGSSIPSANGRIAIYKGQTICALIDDTPYEGISVPSSGDVVLPATPTTRLVIGYPYTSRLITLPMDVPSERGTSQGKTSRVSQIAFRLLDSLYLEHGPQNRPLLPGGSTTSLLYSGDVRIPYDQPHDRRPRVEVRTSKPLPLTILAAYPEVAQTQ